MPWFFLCLLFTSMSYSARSEIRPKFDFNGCLSEFQDSHLKKACLKYGGKISSRKSCTELPVPVEANKRQSHAFESRCSLSGGSVIKVSLCKPHHEKYECHFEKPQLRFVPCLRDGNGTDDSNYTSCNCGQDRCSYKGWCIDVPKWRDAYTPPDAEAKAHCKKKLKGVEPERECQKIVVAFQQPGEKKLLKPIVFFEKKTEKCIEKSFTGTQYNLIPNFDDLDDCKRICEKKGIREKGK